MNTNTTTLRDMLLSFDRSNGDAADMTAEELQAFNQEWLKRTSMIPADFVGITELADWDILVQYQVAEKQRRGVVDVSTIFNWSSMDKQEFFDAGIDVTDIKLAVANEDVVGALVAIGKFLQNPLVVEILKDLKVGTVMTYLLAGDAKKLYL